MIRYFQGLYILPQLLLKDRKLKQTYIIFNDKTIVKKDLAQTSNQFLATTKLATNKPISLKTYKIIKSKMYF